MASSFRKAFQAHKWHPERVRNCLQDQKWPPGSEGASLLRLSQTKLPKRFRNRFQAQKDMASRSSSPGIACSAPSRRTRPRVAPSSSSTSRCSAGPPMRLLHCSINSFRFLVFVALVCLRSRGAPEAPGRPTEGSGGLPGAPGPPGPGSKNLKTYILLQGPIERPSLSKWRRREGS